jgi:hypothetical protein
MKGDKLRYALAACVTIVLGPTQSECLPFRGKHNRRSTLSSLISGLIFGAEAQAAALNGQINPSRDGTETMMG